MPGVREELDGAALARWARLCLDGLERRRDEINALNVFPVADADTGTNLVVTMRAAVEAMDAEAPRPGDNGEPPSRPPSGGDPAARAGSADMGRALDAAAVNRGFDGGAARRERESGPVADATSVRAVVGAMARAATAGARGNSGIILSQVLRGIAEAVAAGPLTATTLRTALRRSAVLVRESLSEPVEGTMLTVLEAAADRAEDYAEDTLAGVAQTAADGAAKALGDTPSQLDVLRAAGVVDAGARGLLILLDSLVTAITGQVPFRPEYRGSEPVPVHRAADARPGEQPLPPLPSARNDRSDRPACAGGTASTSRAPETAAGADAASDDSGVARPRYEVMYLLSDTDENRIATLRNTLARLGDSVVVVGDGGGTWSAHVHCADAGAAVEAGLSAGAVSRIRIEGLVVDERRAAGPADRGILAVTAGTGAARLFEDAGAVVLDGQVTAEALLTAIREMPHREVVVLPNGALPAHELVAVSVAARDGRREVLMLPSGSMVQGLAALALHDGGRTAADDVFAMSEAAAATRWGAVRVAAQRALTIVGTCEQGDGLGLVGHDVVVIDPVVGVAARTLLDRMLGLGGELVTLLLGADAPAGLGEALTEHIIADFPGVEVITYDGGQSADLVQIGVE
ncbi:DAK2 domain-containing protein [Nocardia wallacei]|uniref:DAK2 domain-containing protein n=1 Tax=Nocardia wallacei TaxID=480035 RepID=UPI002455664C|nr:DAK2 domain-containing protein [Nocardia wallacei]